MTMEQSVIEQQQEKYVTRLRARLSRPKITIEDARDGMLDCFVSTYFAGVKEGLEGIVGVDAGPDEVARVTARMFRDRLRNHGATFEAPTADALNEVKEEVDREFHFSELPVELSSMHDQVCTLLIAKADGLLEHDGDRSVVQPKKAAKLGSPPSFGSTPPAPAPSPRRMTPTHVAAPTPPPARASDPPPPPRTSTSRATSTAVTASLRQALAAYLEETGQLALDNAEPSELVTRLERARSLAQSIADFS